MNDEKFVSRPLWWSSIVIALFVSIASFIGLFTQYPYSLETENWQLQAQGQDIGNLAAAVIIIISSLLAKRGSLRGYLIWIGTLFYTLYAYIVYAVAVHFNSLFLIYVAILGLTLYTIIFSLSKGVAPISPTKGRKLAGRTLIGIGILFGLLWLSEIIPATFSGEVPQSLRDAGLIVNPIHVIDLSAVLPALIITGYLALKNKAVGLFFVTPWLMFSVLMGASIVAAMVLMVANGYKEAWVPMTMVSTVVLASLLSITKYLAGIRRIKL